MAQLPNSDKILELLGAEKLSNKSKIKTLLESLIDDRLQTDPYSFENNLTKLLNELGAGKLTAEVRRDLTDKLVVITEVEASKFIKDSKPKLINENGTINKDYFQWAPNQKFGTPSYRDLTAGKYAKIFESYQNVLSKQTSERNKISKNDFIWSKDGYGGMLTEQDATEDVVISGMTDIVNQHSHEYEINSAGDGETSIVNEHSHLIENFMVSAVQGHQHKLLPPTGE